MLFLGNTRKVATFILAATLSLSTITNTQANLNPKTAQDPQKAEGESDLILYLISAFSMTATSAINSGSETMMSIILAPFFSSSESFAAVDRKDAKQMNNVRAQLLACEMVASEMTDCEIVQKISRAATAKGILIPAQAKNLGTLISLTLRAVSEQIILHPNEPEIFASDEGVTLVTLQVIHYYSELVEHGLIADSGAYNANFYYRFIGFLTRSFLQTTIAVQ